MIEYREGGDAATVRKLPGKVTFPDITLKWGITDSRELYDWHRAAVNGQIQRKNGSIILLDDTAQEKVRWNFFGAWPSKWDGPDFSAKGNEVAIDTLTVELRARGAGVTAFQTEFEFCLPRGYVDEDGRRAPRGTHAAGHGGGRDPAAQGPARAGESRLPGGHPAVAGHHAAGRAGGRSIRR